MKNTVVTRPISNLGIAAYIRMHGHTVTGTKGKALHFEATSSEELEQIYALMLQFQPPNPFCLFDGCLMYIKSIENFVPPTLDPSKHKAIPDYGVASYLLLHNFKDKKITLGSYEAAKFKIVGKKDKVIYFNCPPELEPELKQLSYEYVASQFHIYDSHIMGLKKTLWF